MCPRKTDTVYHDDDLTDMTEALAETKGAYDTACAKYVDAREDYLSDPCKRTQARLAAARRERDQAHDFYAETCEEFGAWESERWE